jgi:hypothetical protein
LNTDSAVIMRYIDVFDDSYSAIAGSGGNLFLSNNSGQTWYKLQLQGVANTVDYKTINIVEYTNVSNTHRIFISYTLGNSTGIYYFDCVLSTLFNTTTIEIAEADRQNTTTISDTYDYAIHSASSTYGRIYYAGNGGSFSYDINNNAGALKLEYNATNYNNIYAFGDGDDHAIAVSTTGISYTTNGSSWNHKTFAELGLSTMVLNSVFIQSLSNAIAVGSQGEFIYSTDWQNGVWQMVPDNLLNSSGMRDRIRGPENNLKSISMPDANTMIIADTITPFISNADFTQTQLGYSKIQYCFLPNLFNRDNNTVFDVSGNSMFDGHITGQATLVINDGNPNTFTVSNDAVNANTKAITLTTTDALTLTDGSVNFIMDGIGATSLRGATTFDLDASGIISINSTDGDINIGNDTILVDQAINIGTGESARTITVGNATGTTKLDINAGTDGIDISSNGHLSIDASGHLSIDAGSESNSQSMDIGKKTHIIEIGKTDERTVIEPIINQLYNDFDSVINIGVSDPITNPGTEDASRVLINIGNYKQNALEGERKSNIINIGGGKDILSLGGTITYSSTEISTSKNKGFQINESHPLHDGIEAYINQAGTTPDMTNIVNTDGIYSYTFTNPAFNAYLLNTGSVNNSDSIEAYIIANSPNHNMTGIADAGGAYTYTVFNPDLEAYIVGTYKPYNTGAGSGIRVTDNLDRDAGYLVVSDDRNGWSMKPTKYGSNSLKIDVNSLILRDDNGYVDGTDVSGIHDIKNGIVMLTKTDSEPTNYKLSVQQIDISNILIRDSNNSTLSKQFVNTELVVQNDVSFNKDLSVGGDVYIEGELRATSTVSSYIINTTVTDYEFILTQDMSLGGILFVGGDASFNANMDISGNVAIGKHNPIVTLDISANDAIRIPVGTTIQRPIFNNTAGYLQITGGTVTTESAQLTTSDISGYIGSIRYNETNKQFEGFGPGDSWGSLGGVVNVAQNTKIIAESAPAETNNQLQFFTANTGSIVGALSTGTASHPHDLVTSVSNSLTEVITLGTYTGLEPTTTGSGTGAILTIVAETDLITSVIVTDAGSGYAVGDKISVTAVDLQSKNTGRTIVLDITLTANDIVNNAAERMRIDSNGYIGIGTTTPQSKLDVEGSVRIGSGYSGNNTITTNPANGMIIEGNVGIGTSNPQTNLDISNNIFFDVSNNTGSTTYTNIITGANAYDDDGGNLRLKGGGEGSNNYIDINSLITPLILKTGVDDLLTSISLTTGTDTYGNYAAASGYRLQKWDFDNNQAVLPGNISAIISFSYHYPTTTITSITVTTTGSGYTIGDTCRISHSNGSAPFSSQKITLTAEHFDGGDNSSINLVTTNTTRVHVNNTGKVGIGTNSPNVILDINGTDAIRLPVGIGSERPIQNGATDAEVNKYIGSIRYHSGNQQFEGFGPGNAWGSLGGVVNVAQNTKIIAESGPAETNNQLQFFTAPKFGILNNKTNHFLNKINNRAEPITDGTYSDLPITGGSGSGATLQFSGDATGITSIGILTTMQSPSLPGFPGYIKGDILTVTAANLIDKGTGRTTDLVFTLTTDGPDNILGGDDIFLDPVLDNDGTMAERMIVDSNGYVGIGTTAPLELLDVGGDALINGYTIGKGSGNKSNTAFGFNVLSDNIHGDYNIAIGHQTLLSNIHGGSNTAIGYQALMTNVGNLTGAPTEGVNNTAIGFQALQLNRGYNNTALGYRALGNATGISNNNIAIGSYAGQTNIYGGANTYLGYDADCTGPATPTNQATATAVLYDNADEGPVDTIKYISVTFSGSGYNSIPTVEITGGEGNGATATAVLYDDVVNGQLDTIQYIIITNRGSGYTSAPTIVISGGITWNHSTAIGFQSKITKSDQIVLGKYDFPPEVYIPGNLGIGTTTPQSKLDVNGGVAIGATYSGTTTAPSNGMIVEGNVGIGTTTPVATLDVIGNIRTGDTNAGTHIELSSGKTGAANEYRIAYIDFSCLQSDYDGRIICQGTAAAGTTAAVGSGTMQYEGSLHTFIGGDIRIIPLNAGNDTESKTSNIQLWATFDQTIDQNIDDGASRRAADITCGYAETNYGPSGQGAWGNEYLSFGVGNPTNGEPVSGVDLKTERMRITTTGVGIGTTTPQYTLDVSGQIAGHSESIFYSTTALAKAPRSHAVLTLENDAINSASFSYGKPCLFMGWNGTDTWAFGQGGSTDFTNGGDTTTLGLGPGPAGSWGWVPQFNFTTNGHMGIGTNTPTSELEVVGTITAPNYLINDIPGFTGFDGIVKGMYGLFHSTNTTETTTPSTSDGLNIGTNDYNGRLGMSIVNDLDAQSRPNASVQFHTHEHGVTWRTPMTIKYNGCVGIGTNSPTNVLHLKDKITEGGELTFGQNSTNGGGVHHMDYWNGSVTNTDSGGGHAFWINHYSGSNILLCGDNTQGTGVPASGVVSIGASINESYKLNVGGAVKATSYNAISDIRHKENVCDLENALEKINAIRGVNFSLIGDNEKRLHSGIIAQEVAEIIPEAICKSDDEKWSANYNTFIGYLIESVKTLSKENETLKTKVNTLESTVGSLESTVGSLESTVGSLETKMEMIMKHLNL